MRAGFPVSGLAVLAAVAGAATNGPPRFTVEVVAAPVAAAGSEASAWSGAGVLARVPGATVRQQGFGAPQADISLRGAAFQEGGFLLGGVPLLNPQTEHFAADLPIPPELLRPPELRTGMAAFRDAPGFPAGAVALDFAPVTAGGYATAGGGNAGQIFGRALESRVWNPAPGTVVGASGFASWDAADRTDGRADNYLRRALAGGHAQAQTGAGRFDLLAAGGDRRFGARGFYGAPPSFAAEERVREALVAGTAAFAADPDAPWQVGGAWSGTDDTYWLDRTDHGRYENHHRTHHWAAHAARRQPLGADWSLDARLDGDWSAIRSRYRGTIPSTGLGHHDRGHAALALVPSWSGGPWEFAAGGAAEAFTDGEPAWLPAAGATYRPATGQEWYASWREAVRRPSFTELNYESPGSLGNRGLKREHARVLETGWRQERGAWTGGAALFFADARGTVDWVKFTPGGRWTAANLDAVRTFGAAAHAVVPLTPRLDLEAEGLWLRKTCDTRVLASRYALDYPGQQARLGVAAAVTDTLHVDAWQGAAHHADNAARSGGDWDFPSGLEARWQVPRCAGLTVSAGLANAWNRRFETFPGQPSAGRRAYAAAQWAW
jgi:hypothetical protein